MPSFVWDYFEKIGTSNALCKIEPCNKILKVNGTKGLITHLACKHGISNPDKKTIKQTQDSGEPAQALKPAQATAPKVRDLKACRVCGNSDMYTNLFYNINKELLKNLTKIVEFEINDKDGFSKWICRECVEHVEMFISFRIKYAETHKKNQPKPHHFDIKVEEQEDNSFDAWEEAWEDDDEFEAATLSKGRTSRKRKASSDSLQPISKVFVEEINDYNFPASTSKDESMSEDIYEENSYSDGQQDGKHSNSQEIYETRAEYATKRDVGKIMKKLDKITSKLDGVAKVMRRSNANFTKITKAESDFTFERIDSVENLDLLEEKLKAHYKQPTADSNEFVKALTNYLASKMNATRRSRLDIGLAKSFMEEVFEENFLKDQLGWTSVRGRIAFNGYEGILHLVMESAKLKKILSNRLICFCDVSLMCSNFYKWDRRQSNL